MAAVGPSRGFLHRRRRTAAITFFFLAAVVLLWYAFLVLCWPDGMSARYLLGYWTMGDKTASVSPSGETVIYVRLDPGAVSSGPLYVLVIHRHHWWRRWRVVTCGWAPYVDPQEAIRWVNGSTFIINLADYRRDDEWSVRTVTLR